MLRNFLKNRKAQNTAEYALLIALVVAAIIAMQTYAQRSIQARIHDVANYMANATSNTTVGISGREQYEPYYLSTNYDTNDSSTEKKLLGNGVVGQESHDTRNRGGFQNTTYNNAQTNGF